MARKSKKIAEAVQHITNMLRMPDLSVLGGGISSLPVSQWSANMLFFGTPDKDLLELTGSFPATLRQDKTTHPIFVLKANPTGHFVCPCSSKGSRGDKRFIRAGCALKMKNETTERESFLVEACGFTLPLDCRFSRKLIFGGQVPESCVVDRRERT
jgi:hypothetical protein